MTTRNVPPRRPAPASAQDRGSARTAADRLGAPRPAATAAAAPKAPQARQAAPQARQAAPKAPPRALPLLRRGRLRLRLIPLLIFVAVLMLGVRVGDVFVALTRGSQVELVTVSQAQGAGEPGASSSPAPQAPAPTPQALAPTPQAPAPQVAMPPPPSMAGTPVEVADAPAPLAGEASGTLRAELLQRLSERRDEIDRRVREVEQREALLAAAEQRIDQKVTELSQLRSDIEKLLNQVDKRQEAQLDSLVKIYETMKPKEAARIFEEMDMPVLLSVLERMKESKSAPVLAAMDPVTAKDVTAELVARRALPPGVQQQAARP